MYKIAKIAVEGASYAFDKEYTYFIPDALIDGVRAGMRVRMPFGNGNKRRTGLILEVCDSAEREKNIKPLSEILDAEPVLDDEGLFLLRYLKEFTFCTYFDALKTLVPAGLGLRPEYEYSAVKGIGQPSLFEKRITDYLAKKKKPVSEKTFFKALGLEPGDEFLKSLLDKGIVVKGEVIKRRVLDEKVCMVRLCGEVDSLKLTKPQKAVVDFLGDAGEASLREICYFVGVTRAVADRLKSKEIIEYYDVPRLRGPYADSMAVPAAAPELSEDQSRALDSLKAMLLKEKPKPALLYGITGSGKTEVFLSLIESVAAMGRGAIVLVPEISLTAQAVRAFQGRFGSKVAVLHSGLSLGERMDEWHRARDGSADIVVGTRSAVFAPLKNIGLIVIDEEQEHTYHSEKSPRFHARDVARARCSYHGALLLLASATPSVESYYHARRGAYELIELGGRFGGAVLPDVYAVDLRDSENLSESHIFGSRLLEELSYNLDCGEQSILLLNRRGYSTLIRCSSCGAAEECPYCSVSMTFHNANGRLVCHYCGHTSVKPDKCRTCGSELVRYSGYGTQKIEEELRNIFPSARILRMDMDSTMTKFSHERLFNSFLDKEYDIMVGTQMVAKGLNFPDVTLVGVLAADQALYAMDFRGHEKAFALFTQVAGRSGRGEKRGRAIIQTYMPDNPIIAFAVEQDYPGFFKQEIRSRELHLYPPFCVLAGIGFSGVVENEVRQWAEKFLEKFRELAALHPGLPLRVLGPVPADTPKAAGKYRQKLIVKCKNNKDTRRLFDELLIWFHGECKTVSAFIDMYYDRI